MNWATESCKEAFAKWSDTSIMTRQQVTFVHKKDSIQNSYRTVFVDNV